MKDAAPPRSRPLTHEPREPAIRLPWQAVTLGLIIAAAYAAQLGYGGGSPDPAAILLGLTPAELWSGKGSGLFTYVVLNGGTTQAGLAVVMAMILATPMARPMPGVMGLLGLLSFFLVCGAAGGLLFAALNPEGRDVLIGSSAAVSGLLAAAVTMVGRRRDAGLLSNQLLLAIGGIWLLINVVAAFTDAIGRSAFSEYGWQAHVGGFLAGALLARPWARLFGSRRTSFDSPPDLRDPSA
jgi:membrane associated rhomboid family serine protease